MYDKENDPIVPCDCIGAIRISGTLRQNNLAVGVTVFILFINYLPGYAGRYIRRINRK